MKRLPTESLSFTEIGGVGGMIYKAVRFPEFVPEYDHERKKDIIVPVCTFFNCPEAGTHYSLTGQDFLVSLCNLYKKECPRLFCGDHRASLGLVPKKCCSV